MINKIRLLFTIIFICLITNVKTYGQAYLKIYNGFTNPEDYYNYDYSFILNDTTDYAHIISKKDSVYQLDISKNAYEYYLEENPDFSFKKFKNLQAISFSSDFSAKDSLLVISIINEVPRLKKLSIISYFKLPVIDSLVTLVINGYDYEAVQQNNFKDTLNSCNNKFPALKQLTVKTVAEARLSDDFFDDFPNISSLLIIDSKPNDHYIFTGISRLPSSICKIKSLEYLLIDMPELNALPNSFGNLIELNIIEVLGWAVTSLPKSFSELENLEIFNCEYENENFTEFNTFPVEFLELKKLHNLSIYLNTKNNKNIDILIKKMPNLKSLTILNTNMKCIKTKFIRNKRLEKKAEKINPIIDVIIYK